MSESCMTASDFRTWLSTLADAEATIPAREVLRRLPPTDPNEAHHVGSDMTLEQVASEVGRATSTVRTWCNSERLTGAYRLCGRDWRIPQAALRKLLDAQGRENARIQVQNGQGEWDDWRSAS